jgi:hypothetical protein
VDAERRYHETGKFEYVSTVAKAPEVQYHHEVYNQFLWNMF